MAGEVCLPSDYCDYCGRRLDAPGIPAECREQHFRFADRAEEIVEEIEKALHGRKGLGWGMCDEDIQAEIRAGLADIIRPWLREDD